MKKQLLILLSSTLLTACTISITNSNNNQETSNASIKEETQLTDKEKVINKIKELDYTDFDENERIAYTCQYNDLSIYYFIKYDQKVYRKDIFHIVYTTDTNSNVHTSTDIYFDWDDLKKENITYSWVITYSSGFWDAISVTLSNIQFYPFPQIDSYDVSFDESWFTDNDDAQKHSDTYKQNIREQCQKSCVQDAEQLYKEYIDFCNECNVTIK